MGYELNRLMAQYGVSSPTIQNANTVAPENKDAYEAYRREYMNRMQDTPQYAAPPQRMPYQGPGMPVPQEIPGGPPPPVQTAPLARQAAMAPGGMGMDAMNKNLLEWYRANPDVTNQGVQEGQMKYGITNRDLYGATGNYWGNTLRAPVFKSPVPMAPVSPAAPVAPTALPNGELTPEGVSQIGNSFLRKNQQWQGSSNGGGSGGGYGGGNSAGHGDGGNGGSGGSASAARGGLMRKRFEDGGLARSDYEGFEELDQKYAQPTPRPVARRMTMEDLVSRYNQPSGYADQIKAANASSSASQEAFKQTLQKAMAGGEDEAPSKAEMYFRLAAAIGSPTKTGHISERLGNAAKAMGDYQKETRETQAARKAKNLLLTLEEQKLAMQGSKDELTTLRTLAADEGKEKRAITAELMKDYIKSGQPQSEAGKVAADAGMKPGTPEYSKFVTDYVEKKMESGDWYKQAMLGVAQSNAGVAQLGAQIQATKLGMAQDNAKKLTPNEANLKTETEDLVNATTQGLSYINQAFKLNPNTFDGTLLDTAQRKILENTNPKDPRVVATRLQENLLGEKALSGLKAAVGGNPTEGERKIIMDLQGIGAKSKEERAAIMQNAARAMKAKLAQQQKRLQEISSGQLRIATPVIPALGEE